MDDIRRQDLRLFTKELLSPLRIILTIGGLLFFYARYQVGAGFFQFLAGSMLILLVASATAWSASVHRRFLNKRTEALWNGCRDRLARFEEVLRKLSREQVAEFREMPRTIRNVASSLYGALRRADMIAHEVQLSERGLYAQPPAWDAPSHDPQSKELYRIADKNIAEYRSQFAGVMAGVQRTEAQSAVFMTTLDTLRMKMIGYRLVGRSPELSSGDFLEALAEARAQLQAIDHALEELDLGHYPKTISVVPPPPPDDALREHLEQR